MSATEIIGQTRGRKAEEKRALVGQIWTQFGDELGWVDPDLTPEVAAELDRRLADFEKNPQEGIPSDQVQANLKKRFGWRFNAVGVTSL
jgi:putative addiction module component (TIGR02574 family)